jgi:transcriptional regulator with XRE-family HTH domain
MKEKEWKNPMVGRIYKTSKELGISKPVLIEKTKIAKNALTNWENRMTVPAADTAIAIADLLHCSVKWLITGVEDIQEEFSIEEKNLIFKYRTLDDQGQHEMNTLLEAKIKPVEKSKRA